MWSDAEVGPRAAPAEVGLACAAVRVSSASRDATACVRRSAVLCEAVEQVSRPGQLLGVGLPLAAWPLLRFDRLRKGCNAALEQEGSMSLRDTDAFCGNAWLCIVQDLEAESY